MGCEIASVSHRGNVRLNNQDHIYAECGLYHGQNVALLAVADGMGGLACGDQSSEIIVRLLAQWWARAAGQEIEEASESLDAVIYEAHRQIYDLSELIGNKTGSTLSLVYVFGEMALVKQIGDSRVYRIRNRTSTQLTTDQTWANQMVADGKITPQEADRHRLRNALVNALGASAELEIATLREPVLRGDAFLICSDGFYREAPMQQISTRLKMDTPQQVLQWALAVVLAGEARDNASAVLCRMD